MRLQETAVKHQEHRRKFQALNLRLLNCLLWTVALAFLLSMIQLLVSPHQTQLMPARLSEVIHLLSRLRRITARLIGPIHMMVPSSEPTTALLLSRRAGLRLLISFSTGL
jgi:hypothetical protein